MSDSNTTEIEQGISSEVDDFVVRAPKKNHDAMIHLGKQFSDILKKYGGPNSLYFQLNNTETPMGGDNQHSQNRLGEPGRGCLVSANIL
ncbi:MAG: hypothetical protein M3297_01370 [Thermoproteota archaeon]|nr:hypothetical protein [Thermoproteota archaeon]